MPKNRLHKPRSRIIAALLALFMLFGTTTAIVMVTSTGSARAADTGGYPWWNAPCEFGTPGGTSCTNPNNSGDLYDWFESPDGTFSGNGCGTSSPSAECFDSWKYEYRNCTSYVAWKISQEFKDNGSPRNISGWKDAANWATAAQAAHYTLDPVSAPQVGDIAVWGTEVGDGFGHVAYVASVDANGVATFDEYNVAGTGAYTSSWTSANHPGGPTTPNWYIHMGTPADAASSSAPSTGYRIAFQANTGTLFTDDSSSGAATTNQGVASGTNPSITSLPSGGYEEAFQANTGTLYVAGTDGTFDTGLGMMAGTSPSITGIAGGFQIALQANTGTLFLYTWNNGTANAVNLNQGMAPGTSPAIASLASGGYQIAFQANTNQLFLYGNNETGNTGQGMAPGTSPAIAASSSGGFQAAFQANTGALCIFWSGSGPANTGYGMLAGTSPSITALSSGGYEQAFQANTGHLWEYGSGGSSDLGQGMATGTNPAVSADSSGFYIAFQANTGSLYLFTSSTGVTANLNQGMASGTSPAIASP